jgi:DNA-binding winged helix-turn-helix (wHTH) protein/Tol biopolymer transport system component
MSLDLSSSFLHFKIPMSESSKNDIYQFDQFKLDIEKLMLYRREEEMSLPPKVIKTLAVLVESSGSILSKEELIDRVWEDSVVEESNLSQHLYLLRKTLGNKPDGQPYIDTLRRRGYRFTGDVHIVSSAVKKVSEKSESEPPPASVAVERDGNVLRIVDWKNAAPAAKSDAALVDEEAEVTSRSSIGLALALGSAAFLIVAATVTVFWYQTRPVASVANDPKELTVVRLTNGTNPIDATISPDGDHFVYHESDGEISRLWLQQVGQSSRIEIGSTSDRMYAAKTFSPDGRFVYYVASEKVTGEPSLYRVPAMGGPHSKVLIGVYGPVSFSPDGNEIVFLRFHKEMTRSSLVIADKDGRQERTLFETAHPRRIVGPPSWSPDGKLVAFGEADLGSGALGGTIIIRGISLSDASVQNLSDEKWDTLYRIVWTHAGNGLLTIATRANDGRSPRRDQVYYISLPAGVSRRLTNDGNRHYVWGLGITKDEAVIAVPYGRSSQIWSVDINDARSSEQISAGIADGGAGLATLPDGRVGYIARTGDALNVWVMNPDGSGAKQLTSDPPVVEELRADPQGRYFIFLAEENARSHLFRIDVDGANRRQLTFGDGYEGDSTISPDGNWVVYGSVAVKDAPMRTELWKVSTNGGEPVRFSEENCASPTYSPDGSMVSCVRDEKEILVLSGADGKILESYKLPTYATINFGAGWTSDASGLTFIRAEKNFSNLWMQPRTGGAATKLTNFTSGYLSRYVFAADGSRLFVARGYPLEDAILITGFR